MTSPTPRLFTFVTASGCDLEIETPHHTVLDWRIVAVAEDPDWPGRWWWTAGVADISDLNDCGYAGTPLAAAYAALLSTRRPTASTPVEWPESVTRTGPGPEPTGPPLDTRLIPDPRRVVQFAAELGLAI